MGLQAVSVPAHMVRTTANALRRLSDVAIRRDMRPTVADARRLATSFERLLEQQAFPEREDVVAKAPFPKLPEGAWRPAVRRQEFVKLFEEEILPEFLRRGEGTRGQCRFTLVLTFVEG